MEKARDGGMQRQTAGPADSSTEGASSTMPAKATRISVRRAEGEMDRKLLMSRTKGLVALPRCGWRLEVSAKQRGGAGRIRSRSRSITAPLSQAPLRK